MKLKRMCGGVSGVALAFVLAFVIGQVAGVVPLASVSAETDGPRFEPSSQLLVASVSATSAEPRMESPAGIVLRIDTRATNTPGQAAETTATATAVEPASEPGFELPAGVADEIPESDESDGAAGSGPDSAWLDPADASRERAAESRALPTERVASLNVGKEADVSAVLRALARAGDQDILISKGVEGTISLNITDVPWDQAFKGVLSSAGLTYTWQGDIIRVMTLEDMRKDLEIEKVRQEQEQVRAALRDVEPREMRIIKVKFASAKRLGESLSSLVAGTGNDNTSRRISVTVDDESNTIIVHATEPDIQKVAALVSALDRPKQQVLIESKIIEASHSTARQLGIQWGGLYSGIGGKYRTLVSPGAEPISQNFGANFPANLDDGLGMTVGFMRQKFGGGEILNLQLSALQEDGQVNILSSPSITTLDNETATIESGEERAYRETSGTGNDLDVSIEWKKATLKLSVTPHIIDQARIRMDVEANKDSFDESKQESNGEFPVNTKNAKTSLLLLDGETAVIGGLSQERQSNAETGIPFLKDLPLIGHLFMGTNKGSAMDEVLIFITPYILGDGAQG